MAATPEGRRLTEAHRLEQQQVRAEFLAEFIALWALLDTDRLDETGPGWVRAVLRTLAVYRLLSAQVATQYYWNFAAAEAPDSAARPRIELPPGVERPGGSPPPPPAVSSRRERTSSRRRNGRQSERARRPRGEDVIPEPRQSAVRWDFDEDVIPEPRRSDVRWDFDEDAVARSLDTPRTRIEIPDIDWEPRNRAAEISLNITGPIGQKSKIGRGRTPRQARDISFVESSGVASRHVLTGGRQSLLTLLQDDPQVQRWIRVTDGDPCAFCAMLAGRGPVFLTEQSAGFSAHDHCACTAEPVYSMDAPWPGRAQEFHKLWNEHIRNRYSGAEARRQWRRLYEGLQREARQVEIA